MKSLPFISWEIHTFCMSCESVLDLIYLRLSLFLRLTLLLPCLSLPLPLSSSVSLAPSVSLSPSLSFSHSLSPLHSLAVSFSHSFSLSFSPHLSFRLLTLSVFLSPTLSISHTDSLCLTNWSALSCLILLNVHTFLCDCVSMYMEHLSVSLCLNMSHKSLWVFVWNCQNEDGFRIPVNVFIYLAV